jgi:hypothetical protein
MSLIDDRYIYDLFTSTPMAPRLTATEAMMIEQDRERRVRDLRGWARSRPDRPGGGRQITSVRVEGETSFLDLPWPYGVPQPDAHGWIDVVQSAWAIISDPGFRGMVDWDMTKGGFSAAAAERAAERIGIGCVSTVAVYQLGWRDAAGRQPYNYKLDMSLPFGAGYGGMWWYSVGRQAFLEGKTIDGSRNRARNDGDGNAPPSQFLK